MNISLLLLFCMSCGAYGTAARRVHGKRYNHASETGNFDNSQNMDRGDEFRELHGQLPADVRENTATTRHPSPPNIEATREDTGGFNGHIVEEPATIVANKEDENRNDEKTLRHSLRRPAVQIGYGFKFSSTIPQDIRYTIEKEVPSDELIDEPHIRQLEHLQDMPQEAEIQGNQPLVGIDAVDTHHHVENNVEVQSIPQSQVHESTAYDNLDVHQGFSIGSRLLSIAQGSANQARSAVANQHVAAQQAVFVAKSGLAQSAIQAAATAIAALAGKEVLVHSLERQTGDAKNAIEHEISQLELTKKTVSTARHAAQQAAYHVSVLAAALNNAHQTAEQAETNAKSAAAELASQTNMVGDAKNRLDTILGKLQSAQVDYEATMEAAGKASAAAKEAQHNAHALGNQASLALQRQASVW